MYHFMPLGSKPPRSSADTSLGTTSELAQPRRRGVDCDVLHSVIRNAMPLVSIRLPDDVEARLAREAVRLERPKSELARDAIIDYLDRMERERFLGEIARAARDRGDDEALAAANEA